MLSAGAVDSTVLGRFTNETLGGLEGTLPASKAELRKKNAILQTEVDDLDTKVAVLDAKNTEEEAVINNLIKQVNQLTPVSKSTHRADCFITFSAGHVKPFVSPVHGILCTMHTMRCTAISWHALHNAYHEVH